MYLPVDSTAYIYKTKQITKKNRQVKNKKKIKQEI